MDVLIIEITKMILDFIANLVTSWPFIIFVIVIFLHKEIGDNITKIFDLLTRLKSFKAGDKSITFSEILANIDNENEDSGQRESIPETKPEWEFTPLDEFEKLAILRPDFAILDSWQSVEKRLSKIRQSEDDNVEYKTPMSILKTMVSMNMISQQQFHYIRAIMSLRNDVVHSNFGSITYEDAYRYRNNCIEIMYMLDSISPQ